MVDPDHVALSITRQCRLVSIARSEVDPILWTAQRPS